MSETTDIPFKTSVDTGEAGKSLKDLKKDFNDIQKELSGLKTGTAEYQKALERLGAVKDDIGDLRDTISALNPEGKVAAFAKVAGGIASGFAAAQGAAALFGVESENVQKSMLKVQAAMALGQGIKDIAALGDGFKVLNVIMKANPAAAIAMAFLALGAAAVYVYETFFKADLASVQLEKDYQAQIKATAELQAVNKNLVSVLEAQLKLSVAQGASNEEILKQEEIIYLAKKKGLELKVLEIEASQRLEKQKQKEIQDNDTLLEGLINIQIQLYRKLGLDSLVATLEKEVAENKIERAKEGLDKIAANEKELDALKNGLSILDIERETKVTTDKTAINKKYLADRLADEKAHYDALEAAKWRAIDSTREANETIKGIEKEISDKKKEQEDAEYETFKNDLKKREKDLEEASKKEEELDKKTQAAKSEAITKGLQAAQALTDLYFAHQLRKNKGNAAAELEIRKKQFKVNKAFGIVNAVVDGVGAVQKALNNPYPLNLILAVISGALAAANIVKIASTKFEGGDSSASAGDVGGGVTASAPAIPQPNNTVTKIGDDGKIESVTKPQDQKVFVLETDIKKSNDRVANIEETAKIG